MSTKTTKNTVYTYLRDKCYFGTFDLSLFHFAIAFVTVYSS